MFSDLNHLIRFLGDVMAYKLVFIFLAAINSGSTWAFSLNDCIINGMKGVSSDIAARQIRWACQQKYDEFKRQRLQELARDFGEAVEADSVEQAKYWMPEDAGFHSMEFTNKSTEKAITYIRLTVAPALKDAPCDYLKQRVHSYKITVKPQTKVKLIYPSSAPSECINPDVILARPASWKDISFSSSAKPLEKDPFGSIE